MNGPENDKPMPPRRKFPTRLWLGLAVVLLIWLAWFTFRWEIRGQWYVHQLIQADSPAGQQYYYTRLAALADSGKTLAGLNRLLNEPRPAIRLMGVKILDRYPGPKALPLLQEMLQDENNEVMLAAATALTRRYVAQSQPASTSQPALTTQTGPAQSAKPHSD